MDHHHDLAGGDAEGRGRLAVEDLVDHLDLEEMVAGAQAADLRQAALQGLLADRVGVGARHRAALLGVGEILLGGQAALGEERHAALDQPAQLAGREPQRAARPGPLGHAAHQLVQQLLEARARRRRGAGPCARAARRS